MTTETHRRLRQATEAAHQQLEHRADILGRACSLEARRDLVADFYALHADLEMAAAPWLANLAGFDFETRRRTPMLERDLADLGHAGGTRSPAALRADSVCEALGLLYVAEGSTLGGQVIRRAVAARGQDFNGLSFLDPYGRQTGARWRSFLTVVDTETRTAADLEALLAGAAAGFRQADQRLCRALAHG